jgi:hypothetical protein
VELVKDNSMDTTGFCNSRALGIIRRVSVENEAEFEEATKEPRPENTLTLLNVLYSPQASTHTRTAPLRAIVCGS